MGEEENRRPSGRIVIAITDRSSLTAAIRLLLFACPSSTPHPHSRCHTRTSGMHRRRPACTSTSAHARRMTASLGLRVRVSLLLAIALAIAVAAAEPLSVPPPAASSSADAAQTDAQTQTRLLTQSQSQARTPAAALAAPPSPWLRGPSASAALRFFVVDPVGGSDATCNSADLLTTGSAASLRPCRSIGRALQLITAPGAWLQLLGGADQPHRGGDLRLEHSGVSFSSAPPPTLSAAEVAAAINGTLRQRMEMAAGSPPLWDCTGFANCVRSNGSELLFSGIAFTGAAEHAIAQLHPPTDAGQPRWPPLSVRLSDCSFTRIGGMLRKDGGRAEVVNCNMSHAVSHPSVIGLLELSETDLLLSRS